MARRSTDMPRKLLAPIVPLFRDLERDAEAVLSGWEGRMTFSDDAPDHIDALVRAGAPAPQRGPGMSGTDPNSDQPASDELGLRLTQTGRPVIEGAQGNCSGLVRGHGRRTASEATLSWRAFCAPQRRRLSPRRFRRGQRT
jgi:hypothetical protein